MRTSMAVWLGVAVLVACTKPSTPEPVNAGVSTVPPVSPTAPVASSPNAPASAVASASMQRSIGTATMRPDGTIVLQLRAEGGGAVGDAILVYPPNDPKYQDTLKHLNGLMPGESKPVPPWEGGAPAPSSGGR